MTDKRKSRPWRLPRGAGILAWSGRRKLRDYLDRLQSTESITDLNVRETGLGELKAALHADLVKDQIPDGHFIIVMDHLDEAVKNTRIESIEETFCELPFYIVEVIQNVLEDGRIEQEEVAMVEDLLFREDISTNNRDQVLARLGRWQHFDETTLA